MDNVTQILEQIEGGDPAAAEQLLPLVYAELRRLAARRLAHEQGEHTLQPTELVHEAYLRLVDVAHQQRWDSRGHFFSAAAEAMRRILVERARRRGRQKHGGGLARKPWDDQAVDSPGETVDILALDEALSRLEAVDPQAATLVKLRYFSGLTQAETAAVMQLATRTADRVWAFAKAWLYREMQ
ncbi:MAG: ECF-type sigma factor [Pirellulaceae bacterium]|jgi:RNA polymerase sigma factor (TIGR02999 family)|nr:ECF-type sigma factor [Pirellulaceae bacterium]